LAKLNRVNVGILINSSYVDPVRFFLGRKYFVFPPAKPEIILREHKIFPATKESYRVYIGTGSQNPDIYAY
jgi:hypothetical protein